MPEQNYFEITAFFHQNIYDEIRRGNSIDQALGRNVDDFWKSPENQHVINNLIVIIESLHIEASIHKKFRKAAVDVYLKLLAQVKEEELNQQLSKYEIEVFNESVVELNGHLKTYKIE